ncbi:MAG: TonB-dependent receptor plug domain-containing protein, partial [Candidatus Poribacteria bacterium]|nr:TonB-dependent receptor plug domain-containing protein [Candidatus Poribacteria bacterium]
MEQSYIRSGLLSALAALAFLASAMAQAATLNVTVTDAQTDAELANISITVIPQTGDSREGATDAMGAAQFTELPAGIYAVNASSLSYAGKVVSNVELQAEETRSVEIALFSRVIQLDQVSVTTSRRQEKVLEAPASVSVLDDTQIQSRVALTPMEHFKSVAAVDTFNTGISQGNVTVRGFSNVLSSSLLSLVDNRIASVPSLRVNAYTLVSTPDDDIDQIEVVSGPGSALYGPNSANGVIHILTKSPFGSEGTQVGLATGERGVFVGSCRH